VTIRSTAWRLFMSAWLVYALHWATDFSREHFLVLSIAEDASFRLDKYADMHNDIFVLPSGHAHHGANPGISLIGAVPYSLLRPVVDRVVERTLRQRAGETVSPSDYKDPRMARRLRHAQMRERGLDVRFGMVGLITQVLAMAPLAAGGVVVFFLILCGMGLPRAHALAGAVLYGFGTPMFYRAAYLNHNLAVGTAALVGFWLLWNPGDRLSMSVNRRTILAGVCGGMALLLDYSGGLVLVGLPVYATLLLIRKGGGIVEILQMGQRYAVGSLGPVMMLWFYQWASFGNPFFPPQHYMAPVPWSDLGYQGVTGPQAELFWMLLLDPRFGLFIVCPILLLGLLAPVVVRRTRTSIRWPEVMFALGFSAAMIVFFSAVQYTRLQYIHGIRYIIPVVPFLALLTVVFLLELPKWASITLGLGAIAFAWTQAMVRVHELQGSVLEPIGDVLLGGPRLPALTTLSRLPGGYIPDWVPLSPITALFGTAILLWVIWSARRPARPLAVNAPGNSGP